jgi:hypothetical protein
LSFQSTWNYYTSKDYKGNFVPGLTEDSLDQMTNFTNFQYALLAMHILSYGVNFYRTKQIFINGQPDSMGVYRERSEENLGYIE